MGYKYEIGEDYESRNQGQIDNLTKEYTDRSFEYDAATDEAYQSYANMMRANGALAMTDTIGKASSMSGGYANSYASTAGQQVYNDYLNEIGNAESTFYDRALSQFNSEGSNILNKISVLQNQESSDKAIWEEDYAKAIQDATIQEDTATLAKIYGYKDKVDSEGKTITAEEQYLTANRLALTDEQIEGYINALKKGDKEGQQYFEYLNSMNYNLDDLFNIVASKMYSGELGGTFEIKDGDNDEETKNDKYGSFTADEVEEKEDPFIISDIANTKIEGLVNLEEGEMFRVDTGEGNPAALDVRLGSEVKDNEVLLEKASEDNAEGLFIYNNGIYYMEEGRVFHVEAQDIWLREDEYDELKEYIKTFANAKKTEE
ncbi:MAG: hypothetical protein IJ038_02885 [Clostridia bacterium]|nr:hypothetical protein [Clostridia bacterium]